MVHPQMCSEGTRGDHRHHEGYGPDIQIAVYIWNCDNAQTEISGTDASETATEETLTPVSTYYNTRMKVHIVPSTNRL